MMIEIRPERAQAAKAKDRPAGASLACNKPLQLACRSMAVVSSEGDRGTASLTRWNSGFGAFPIAWQRSRSSVDWDAIAGPARHFLRSG